MVVATSIKPKPRPEITAPTSNLSGLEEIAQYARRSKATVLGWIRNEKFPAAKLGHVWESDKGLIDQWKRDRIEMTRRAEQAATAPQPPKRKRLSTSTKQERW